MTYFSLPLSFMHPSFIVMHPPKPLALSGLSLYSIDDQDSQPEVSNGRVPAQGESSVYVVMQSAGRKSMLERVALLSRSVETFLYMHSDFGTPGEIRYSVLDAKGNPMLECKDWLAAGIGRHGIDMSWLKPGRYSLLVSWQDGDEESAVMYQIEKLQ